jgi:hypothetical protein
LRPEKSTRPRPGLRRRGPSPPTRLFVAHCRPNSYFPASARWEWPSRACPRHPGLPACRRTRAPRPMRRRTPGKPCSKRGARRHACVQWRAGQCEVASGRPPLGRDGIRGRRSPSLRATRRPCAAGCVTQAVGGFASAADAQRAHRDESTPHCSSTLSPVRCACGRRPPLPTATIPHGMSDPASQAPPRGATATFSMLSRTRSARAAR